MRMQEQRGKMSSLQGGTHAQYLRSGGQMVGRLKGILRIGGILGGLLSLP